MKTIETTETYDANGNLVSRKVVTKEERPAAGSGVCVYPVWIYDNPWSTGYPPYSWQPQRISLGKTTSSAGVSNSSSSGSGI